MSSETRRHHTTEVVMTWKERGRKASLLSHPTQRPQKHRSGKMSGKIITEGQRHQWLGLGEEHVSPTAASSQNCNHSPEIQRLRNGRFLRGTHHSIWLAGFLTSSYLSTCCKNHSLASFCLWRDHTRAKQTRLNPWRLLIPIFNMAKTTLVTL